MKETKAIRTKRYIIEKTAHIFNKKGYAGTSMTDLTDATGLTKGSIYGNFRDKDEVAIAAFKYNLGKMIRAFAQKSGNKSTVIEKLLVYSKYYKEDYNGIFDNGGCPILNTATEADDTHPVLKRLVRVAINKWRANLAKLIREGQEKSEIKPDLDPDIFADIILSLIEGGGMLSKATGKLQYFFHSLDRVENIILNEMRLKMNKNS